MLHFLFIVFNLIWCKCGGYKVKIAPGVNRAQTIDHNALKYEEPNKFNGPEFLYFLNGECFSKIVNKNEYTVCPFQNITSKRSGSVRSTLVGVWEQWIVPAKEVIDNGDENTYVLTTSSYTKGIRCGSKSGTKSAMLEFVCLNATNRNISNFEIISVDDSKSCEVYLQ